MLATALESFFLKNPVKKIAKKYIEIGFGNPSFINTEIEYECGTEERFKGIKPLKIEGIYVRIWVGKSMFVMSTNEGFKRKIKGRRSFKILLGFSGI